MTEREGIQVERPGGGGMVRVRDFEGEEVLAR